MLLPAWANGISEAASLATEQAAALTEKVSQFDLAPWFPVTQGVIAVAGPGCQQLAGRTRVQLRDEADIRQRRGPDHRPTERDTEGEKEAPATMPSGAPSGEIPFQLESPPQANRPQANPPSFLPTSAPEEAGATAARVLALQEELNSTKLRALRKIKEQEASHKLTMVVASQEKAALQAQLSQARMATASGLAMPGTPAPSAAARSSATPATGTAAASDVGRRAALLQSKVTALAHELRLEKLARQHAEGAEREAKAEAAALLESSASAEASATEARSELRLALLASAAAQEAAQQVAARAAPQAPAQRRHQQERAEDQRHPAPSCVIDARAGWREALPELLLRRELESAERAVAEAVVEAGAARQREQAELAAANDAEARAEVHAAGARKAQAMLVETKAKARQLLEQKELELASMKDKLNLALSSSAVSRSAVEHGSSSDERSPRTGQARAVHAAREASVRHVSESVETSLSLLGGVDEAIARDLRRHGALQASLDQSTSARAELERRLQRATDELEQARAAAASGGGGGSGNGRTDTMFLRNTLLTVLEKDEFDIGPLLQVLAMHLQLGPAALSRIDRLRTERAGGLGAGLRTLFTPRGAPRPMARPEPPSEIPTATKRAAEPPAEAIDGAVDAAPWGDGACTPRAGGLGDAAASASESAPARALGRAGPVEPRTSGGREGDPAFLRQALSDARLKLSVAHARLEAAESELRGGGGAGSDTSLSYLRSVLVRYIEEDDSDAASDSLFQVIATFLQLDPTTVWRLQAARKRKAAAQRGLWGSLRARVADG